MIRVETAVIVRAPVATVRYVYADYSHWPQVFPTIKGVRLIAQRGLTAVLDVEHVDGHVINELTVTGNEIRLWEVKRRYDAHFVNQFHAIGEGHPVYRARRGTSQGRRSAAAPLPGAICASADGALAAPAGQGSRRGPIRVGYTGDFDRFERAGFDSTLSS